MFKVSRNRLVTRTSSVAKVTRNTYHTPQIVTFTLKQKTYTQYKNRKLHLLYRNTHDSPNYAYTVHSSTKALQNYACVAIFSVEIQPDWYLHLQITKHFNKLYFAYIFTNAACDKIWKPINNIYIIIIFFFLNTN